MVGVGRYLWRSSSPTPLFKQVWLEQVAQGYDQVGSEYLQRRTLHNLSGPEPVPVLCHPRSKNNFPYIQTELPVFQFLPLSLILFPDTIEESQAPSSWHWPWRYLYTCPQRQWRCYSGSSHYDLRPKRNPSIMAAGWPNPLRWHQTMHGTNISSSWLYFSVSDGTGLYAFLIPLGTREKTQLYVSEKKGVYKY